MNKNITYILTTFGSIAIFLLGEIYDISGLVNISVFYFWFLSVVSLSLFSDTVIETVVKTKDYVQTNKFFIGGGIVLTIMALLYYNWLITAIAVTIRGVAIINFNSKLKEFSEEL